MKNKDVTRYQEANIIGTVNESITKSKVKNVSLVDKRVKDSSYNRLTEADQEKAMALARTIDFSDDTSVANFGVETQQKLGSATERISTTNETRAADKANIALTDFTKKITDANYQPNAFVSFISKIPFIGKIVDYSRKMEISHQTVKESINSVSLVLESDKVELLKDNVVLKALKEENIEYITENEVNIAAVEIVMGELKNVLIPSKEKEISKDPSNRFLYEELNEYKSRLNTLDKKRHNMKSSTEIAFMSIPRLTITMSNNMNLVNQIINAHTNVLPLWKNQIAEALMLENQKKKSISQTEFNNMTNVMITQLSKTFKENSLQIAKENERGNVDMSTLRATAKDIEDAFSGIRQIEEDGVKRRIEDSKEMISIRDNMMNSIKNMSTNTSVNSNNTVDVNFEEVNDNKQLNN
jgi:uncharacterized protein YaaN involved in tellurite resistance